MGGRYEFTARIEDAGSGGAYVRIPFDVEAEFGSRRVKVRALVDGLEYRGSAVRMGTPCHIIPVLKAIREKLGKGTGDEVRIILEEDLEPRTVATAPDLLAALEVIPDLPAFYDTLSYTRKREYSLWIDDAKRPATRRGRIDRLVGVLEGEMRTRKP